MKDNPIIVFLGPTLSIKEAQKLLPDTLCLPPIACGDLLRVLRLNPKAILIIDGFFENTPAIWHKEILYALSLGIPVYGASSMGALRAAELHEQGMIGHGKIFEDFKSGVLEDDDEVAVLHSSNENNFEAHSEALVNIRVNFSKAKEQKVLDGCQFNELLSITKNIFYHKRTYENIISTFEEKHEAKLKQLSEWLEDNKTDQKQQDAISLLKHIASLTSFEKPKSPAMSSSVFFRTLYLHMTTTPLPFKQDNLPEIETTTHNLVYESDNPVIFLELAQHFALLYSYIHLNSNSPCCLKTIIDWLETNENQIQTVCKPLDGYYVNLLKLNNLDLDHQDDYLLYYAKTWRAIDYLAKDLELTPEKLQEYFGMFCAEKNITDEQALNDWQKQNNLSETQFEELLYSLARLNFLQQNPDALAPLYVDASVYWLGMVVELDC